MEILWPLSYSYILLKFLFDGFFKNFETVKNSQVYEILHIREKSLRFQLYRYNFESFVILISFKLLSSLRLQNILNEEILSVSFKPFLYNR